MCVKAGFENPLICMCCHVILLRFIYKPGPGVGARVVGGMNVSRNRKSPITGVYKQIISDADQGFLKMRETFSRIGDN